MPVVLYALSPIILIFGMIMLVPLGVSVYYHDAAIDAYDGSVAITIFVGLITWLLTRSSKRELKTRDGFLIVALTWTLIPAFATLPLMFYMDTTFTHAYFETMSGLTTTGATVYSGLDQLPPSINLWRHLLNWLGGMGIIVLAVAILPLLGIGGRSMFKAETPGPMKDSKLTPRIAQTAKALWLVYAGITLACILSLRVAGMGWFDAICHSFAAMALGGFSTHDASVGYFNSVPIEVVLSIFQVIAAGNFATYFLMMRGRSFRLLFADTEIMSMLGLVLLSVLGVSAYLWLVGTYPTFLTSLRYASFNLITIATDCGFANTDFGKWPIFATMWMLFLSSILACSGSTGGGIKMIRTLILAKQAGRELSRLLHPNAVIPVKVGGQVIENQVVFSVLAFIFLYFMTVVTLTFALLLSGLDFISAFSAIIACINNAGPGLGVVGPANNYGGLSVFQTWVCTVAMLAGRLEIFTLLIVLTPGFWKK
ncbi:MAG: potassium transporter TrkG [Parasulfuritortus sp.]|jgi:trk system potassium uptake protein TrkH|nr:potassium transporter TrkG [Parasulfuritortus sp.]